MTRLSHAVPQLHFFFMIDYLRSKETHMVLSAVDRGAVMLMQSLKVCGDTGDTGGHGCVAPGDKGDTGGHHNVAPCIRKLQGRGARQGGLV